MSNNIIKSSKFQEESNNKPLEKPFEVTLLLTNLRNNIWMFGIPSWLFGITDRTVASFADGYLSVIEVVQLLTAFFFLVAWISLKPETSLSSDETESFEGEELDASVNVDELFLGKVKHRIEELQEQHTHMIRQEYILPFPYLCQIYHLLNLKHLETIHSFSLNNLKVVNVSTIEPTNAGGMVKFQTVLESPVNPLRIWRQPIVEAGLTLHSPYTVELNIPAYNDKRIIVLFSAIPLSHNRHKFLIDIYSDLQWPKPILQTILHFASCLTVFEDMPYLRQLAQKNIYRLANVSKASKQETMWLFKRFVDLYGNSLKPVKAIKAIAINTQVVG